MFFRQLEYKGRWYNRHVVFVGQWGEWMKTADRHVGKDSINGVCVSTVFLGFDHSFGGDTPILFETMLFGGEYDQHMDRYSTWEDAQLGHERWVQKVKDAL